MLYGACMQMASTSLILLAILASGQVAADCPAGWTRYDRSCYFLSHDVESWIGAFKLCDIMKGYLVEVADDNENDFLTNFTLPFHGETWMGATDLDIEGEWIWSNSRVEVKYANWGRNQPSNSNFNENCMHSVPQGIWNDNTCHSLLHYVCERPYSDPDTIVG